MKFFNRIIQMTLALTLATACGFNAESSNNSKTQQSLAGGTWCSLNKVTQVKQSWGWASQGHGQAACIGRSGAIKLLNLGESPQYCKTYASKSTCQAACNNIIIRPNSSSAFKSKSAPIGGTREWYRPEYAICP